MISFILIGPNQGRMCLPIWYVYASRVVASITWWGSHSSVTYRLKVCLPRRGSFSPAFGELGLSLLPCLIGVLLVRERPR